jgi:hypothetical protein
VTTLGETMLDVWRQLLVEEKDAVALDGKEHAVTRTPREALRTVYFAYGQFSIYAIEQNPRRTSEWAKRAREGERILQFSYRSRYIANVCEGRLTRYPAWKRAGLPE